MSIVENVVRVRERIAAAAHRAGRNPDEIVLMGVSKTFPVERIREAYAAGLRVFGENRVQELAATGWGSLSVRGLMTVPPYSDDPEGARPFFRQLRAIRDQIASRRLPAMAMDLLSMGMSHDFEVAIEEGSTCVRVGTAIFGDRAKA